MDLWSDVVNRLDCAAYRPRYSDRAKHHKTSTLICCAPHELSFFGHTIRDGGCELVKCVIQREVHGKRRRGRPKSCETSLAASCLMEQIDAR